MSDQKLQKTSFLIAMPSLKESLFSKSLILMAEKNDSGALGFIINSPTATMVKDALKSLSLKNNNLFDIPILLGGPVQTDFFWLIHSTNFETKNTIKIHELFYLSSLMEILPAMETDNRPDIYHAGVGYSGWGANQLEKEIESGSWWLEDLSLDLLFKTPHDEQWENALECLGVDPEMLVDNTNPDNPSIN